MTRADLEKQPAEVQAMFDDVARRYDLTNDVLSLGQDRRWRRHVVRAVDARPGERVLDLAAGTGTSSQPFARPRRHRRPVRLLGRDAARGQAAPAAPAVRGRGRDPAAVRRRHLRRRHDLLRAAQHRRSRRRAARDAAGDPARRPAGGVRVQLADLGAVPHRLHRVPDARAAPARPRGLLEPGRLRLPRRVDPGLARPGRPRRADRRRRLGRPEWRNLSGGIVALHRATA